MHKENTIWKSEIVLHATTTTTQRKATKITWPTNTSWRTMQRNAEEERSTATQPRWVRYGERKGGTQEHNKYVLRAFVYFCWFDFLFKSRVISEKQDGRRKKAPQNLWLLMSCRGGSGIQERPNAKQRTNAMVQYTNTNPVSGVKTKTKNKNKQKNTRKTWKALNI